LPEISGEEFLVDRAKRADTLVDQLGCADGGLVGPGDVPLQEVPQGNAVGELSVGFLAEVVDNLAWLVAEPVRVVGEGIPLF
jgi:hypothetical protein